MEAEYSFASEGRGVRLFRGSGHDWNYGTAIEFGGCLALVSPAGASEPGKRAGWYAGLGFGPIETSP